MGQLNRGLGKGYCFESAEGIRFLVVEEAISRETGDVVYLCQELTGDYRLMVWTEAEITGCTAENSAAGQSLDFHQNTTSSNDTGRSDRSSISGNAIPYQADNRSSLEDSAESSKLQEMMVSFLDADSYGKKLEMLNLMKGKATESMLESMALSMDYELGGGSVEEQYYALERFLKTKKRYEGARRY